MGRAISAVILAMFFGVGEPVSARARRDTLNASPAASVPLADMTVLAWYAGEVTRQSKRFSLRFGDYLHCSYPLLLSFAANLRAIFFQPDCHLSCLSLYKLNTLYLER